MSARWQRAVAAVEERFLVPVYGSAHPELWIAAYHLLSRTLLRSGTLRRYTARTAGGEVRIAYCGRRKRFGWLFERWFDSSLSREGVGGRYPLTDPGPYEGVDADLVAVEIPLHAAARFRVAGWRIAPDAVRWHGEIEGLPPSPVSKSLADDLRKVRKYGYSPEEASTSEDWSEFYREMLIPYARARFGSDGWIPSPRLVRHLARRGVLLFARREGLRAAGICLVRHGASVWAPLLALRGGDMRYLKEGGQAAVYRFLLDWARERGVGEVDLGRTAPFQKDGVAVFKRKWGYMPRPDPLAHRVALKLPEGAAWLEELLSREALYTETASGLALLGRQRRPTETEQQPSPPRSQTSPSP